MRYCQLLFIVWLHVIYPRKVEFNVERYSDVCASLLHVGIVINQAEKLEWLTPTILQVSVGWI